MNRKLQSYTDGSRTDVNIHYVRSKPTIPTPPLHLQSIATQPHPLSSARTLYKPAILENLDGVVSVVHAVMSHDLEWDYGFARKGQLPDDHNFYTLLPYEYHTSKA